MTQKIDNGVLGNFTSDDLEPTAGVKRQVVAAVLRFDNAGTETYVSDSDPLPISGSLSIGATTIASTNNASGTAGNASSTLVAANANRVGGVQLYNSSTSETIHYKEGATATTGNMPLRPGERITTTDGYKGVIDIIRGGSVDATVFYVEGSSA